MFTSYTRNRRSHLWDYVEPGEAFCFFPRLVLPIGCLVMPLSGTLFFSFLLLSSPFFFLHQDSNKYVLSCVIQTKTGGLSKTLATVLKYLAQTV